MANFNAVVKGGRGMLTAYDSPAIWKALPLNLLKFSKNIETKAAISTAASSVVS